MSNSIAAHKNSIKHNCQAHAALRLSAEKLPVSIETIARKPKLRSQRDILLCGSSRGVSTSDKLATKDPLALTIQTVQNTAPKKVEIFIVNRCQDYPSFKIIFLLWIPIWSYA